MEKKIKVAPFGLSPIGKNGVQFLAKKRWIKIGGAVVNAIPRVLRMTDPPFSAPFITNNGIIRSAEAKMALTS